MSEENDGNRGGDAKSILAAAQKTNYKLFGAGLLIAFALAFTLAWWLFSPPPPETPPPPPPVRTLSAGDLGDFLRAVEQADYPRMSGLGNELFREGTIIPGSRELFAEYETTSYSPNAVVYAFHSGISDSSTRRVLLTVGDNDSVLSFLAEEMAIVK